MKAFADLFTTLDETTKTNEKVEALTAYFRAAEPADAAWAIYFLSGRKPKQAVPSKKIREWAATEAGVPDWLFGESYDAVGDVAETVALLLPPPERSSDLPLAEWVRRLLTLRDSAEEVQHRAMLDAWASMDRTQRFVWNKLISGSFRVGVSQQLVTRALGKAGGVDPAVVAHRLMGDWEPTPSFYAQLLAPDSTDADHSRPYPFCLAHAIEGDPSASLGPVEAWQAEWKWDGIRSQLIRRGGDTFLWSRGEELVTDRYPEIATLGAFLPEGTALDGEILPYRDGGPLPFAQLQRRIGRKTLGKTILSEVPVVLVAYDLIESRGEDLRTVPLNTRRAKLEELVEAINQPDRLIASPIVRAQTWAEMAEAREESRDRQAEGLMLKRLDSVYHVGRKRGDWWKWKIEPFTVDAVLTAAQRGSGKRASMYTDYTFSVWDDSGQLVPFAKAYSGLTDEEIARVDHFVRRHMVEKFGPVRTVEPTLVFELAFEGIQRSPRHKSGIAVRFPRILRWRDDKKPADADSLATIRALLPPTDSLPVDEGPNA